MLSRSVGKNLHITPAALLIIALTPVAMVAIVLALGRQGHGEFSAGHGDAVIDPSDDSMLRDLGPRLGGPGQAGQAVVAPGQIAPADPEGRAQR